MNLRDTYNRIAKDWMTDHHSDTWWIEGVNEYLSKLETGASILDVGCGAGEKSKYLIGKGFKVTGVDFSDQMIELAKSQVPQATFCVQDIRQPLTLDEQFDGVFVQAVLLHISKKDLPNVLKNILAPLRPGGYFYAAVKERRENHVEEEVVTENDYGYDYERFFSYYTMPELKNFIEKAGAAVIYEHTVTPGHTNWIQVVAKKLG